MVEREQFTNQVVTTLSVAMSDSVATVTPVSYVGFPSSGQGRIRVGNPAVPASVELLLVEDFATHPWPVTRGVESTTAVSHTVGQEVATLLTAGALEGLVGVYEEGTLVGNVRDLNVVGAGATVTLVGAVGTVTVPGAGTVATDPLWDAKGDLAGGTGANTAVKLTVGANGQVLTADSVETTGLKWATPAGGLGTDTLWDAAGDLAVGSGANTAARLAAGATGQQLVVRAGTPAWESFDQWISYVVDGGGSAITTGLQGFFVVPAGTIIEARLLADQTGSVVVDLWKDTYANFPPVVGDSITASAKPTISSGVKATDATLAGWTTALADGDTVAVQIDSCTAIARLTVALKVRRS